MSTTQSPSEISERLFDILSSSRFLDMEGLGNEVPIFIQPYPVAEEERMETSIRSLASRLRNSGIEVAEVNLFHLIITELKAEELLEDLIADERDYDRQDLLATLKNYSDPRTRIIPRLVEMMSRPEVQLTFVSGSGHVYPFLRTHQLLEEIQTSMMHHPLVLFFPGHYIQTKGLGSQLRLFGSLEGSGYYRAFNLDHYRLHSS